MSTETQTTNQRRVDGLVGISLSAGALLLYTLTLAPTALQADGGEFQFVPWLPGIAHPTGYPLYTLLGWLWSRLLPVGEVAWRMNWFSAVLGAVTVGIVYTVARQLLDKTLPGTPFAARVLAAVIAAATFAVTHTFWSQALIAEVYTLHALFVALILWLALLAAPNVNLAAAPVKWLTFTFGLGLTHHRTTILLLPAVVLFLVLSARQNSTALFPQKSKIKRILTYLALFFGPLLLYLYLPLVAPVTPYATLSLSDMQTLTLYNNSLTGFWQHINASVFSGELQPGAVGLARLALVGQLWRQQAGWLGIALAVVGLIVLGQRRQYDLLLLTGLSALAFVAFNLVYFIGDVFVLFIPVWLIVCLWIGVGSLGLVHWLADRFVRRKTRLRESPTTFGEMEQQLGRNIYRLVVLILLTLCLVICVVPLGVKNVEVTQHQNTAARDRWQAIFADPIPSNAILLSNDRNEIMPMWYYQYVDGRRPDLLGLFPLIVTDPAYATVGGVLEQAFVSQRPVYFIKPMDGLNLKADLTPTGTLILAEPINTTPNRPADLLLPPVTVAEDHTETIKLAGYNLPSSPIKPGDEIIITLYWQPVQDLSVDYTSFVHLVNSDDQGITQNDHRPGGTIYPSRLWQPGEILRDAHTLTLPANLPAGTYRLRIGMYFQPEPGIIWGMGGGQEIDTLVVTSE